MRTGVIGTVVAAACCFTPVLVVPLAALGLSAVLVWLDHVLLPALLLFVTVTVYAGVRLAIGNRPNKDEGC